MIVTLLSTLEILYVISLSTWILLEKRSPVATLAWILSLIALPGAGFVIYFFLGPRRLRRKKMRHARARIEARKANALPSRPTGSAGFDPSCTRTAQLMELGRVAGGAPPAPCSKVTALQDGEACYAALEEAIENAKHHVHFGYYIFEPDDAGIRFRDLLVRRAREGIAVRVLVDAVGSNGIGREFLAPLREAGAKFAWFNKVTLARLRSRINFRNHRKIVVCDGVIGFTGGINISSDYLKSRGRASTPWRDTHVRIEGDCVRWLALTFLDDWYFATRHVPKGPEYFPEADGKGARTVQVVASGPDRDTEAIQKMYFAAIASAQRRVFVSTPYFVPDAPILAALTTAAMRGVDVRILVPRRSDSFVVTCAARSYYDDLIAVGIRIYEYLPAMMHGKTIVVDDHFSAVGTANMDNRSFRLNFEVAIVVYGEAMATELASAFENDVLAARPVTRSDREEVTLGWRFAEAGSRLLSPVL